MDDKNLSVIATERLNRAQRVQHLRNLTGLSRLAFQEEFDIAKGSLQTWENPAPNRSGITAKGAMRLASAMQEKGYQVSQEWIMYGAGNPPTIPLQNNFSNDLSNINDDYDAELHYIREEVTLFLKNHPGAIQYKVNDDAMFPFYQMGDVVAGCRLTGNDINSVLGRDCIVFTVDGQLLFRYLKKGNLPNTYTLVALNRESTVPMMTIYDVELVSASPVTFLRRLR